MGWVPRDETLEYEPPVYTVDLDPEDSEEGIKNYYDPATGFNFSSEELDIDTDLYAK